MISPGRRRARLLAGLLPLVVVLAACAQEVEPEAVEPSSQASAPAGTPATASSGDPPVGPGPLVVLVSLDGFNPVAMRRTPTPALDRMVAEGSGTLNARTAYEQTVTLPNHTGMMTGLMVAGTGGRPGHGVTQDLDDGRTVAQTAGRYVPSIFDVVHDRGRRTALYVSKSKFALYDRSWDAAHGAPDVTGRDDGRDKIDRYKQGTAASGAGDLLRDLRDRPPALGFLHVDLPDKAGHETGFLSAAYLEAVRQTDAVVGGLLDGIAADPALAERTTVLLTADHGGPEGSVDHGDVRDPADYTVPVLAWGRGVARGADLYALNPGRRDPGTGRPSYDGPQPVRNLDVADLALDLLGLPDLPDAGVPGTEPLRVS